MRNKISAAMIIAASLGFSTMALAADGTIKFTGNITDSGYSVTNSNGSQTVILGDVAKTAFTGVNSTAAATKFSLALTACPDSKATIRFDGTPSADNANLFALDADQTATGVAVALYEDDNKTAIPVATNSKAVELAEGANTLNYYGLCCTNDFYSLMIK